MTTTTPDVWDARDCGLLTDTIDDALSGVHTVDNGGTGPDGELTYVVGEPRYRPYRSAAMPCPENGMVMAEHIMRTIHSPELAAAVRASPLADIARRATDVQAESLWRSDSSPSARGLAAVAAVSPRKGGEMRELWAEYSRRIPGATDPIMAMRDLWGSAYVWQFIRGDDARLHDLSGSILSLTSAIDYCGAADDSGAGGHRLYMTAASEGLVHLSGPAATIAARDVVAVGGMMAVKDALATTSHRGHAEPVTPADYVRARAWDGAVAPYYRLMLGTADYRHLSDERGAFASALRCQAIQRATDNVMRYNDITDVVPDYAHHESFNELLLATALRGPGCLTGFGTALAELTDAVLECQCGLPGHEEAAEMSMGTCLWYLLIPRYNVRKQLAAYQAAGGVIAGAYAMPAPGMRSLGCAVAPGDNMFTDDWEPLWRPEVRDAGLRAGRIARRCLLAGVDRRACADAAELVLAGVDLASDEHSLRAAGAQWQRVFDIALTSADCGTSEHTARLRGLVNRIWQQTVLGEHTGPAADANLLMDVDEAARATFELPRAMGTSLRRAFFGLVSGAVELGGLNPYSRLANGLAVVCE
ncbi:MAG TPA: hypothetical protein VGN81_29050 [Pseudonocardiaceae bacterium]